MSLYRLARQLGLALACVALTSCSADDESDHAAQHAEEQGHQHAEGKHSHTEIPAVVRKNLGITFAKVERRAVHSTVTLPGHFEVIPAAQQHYPLPVAGRVTVHVAPLNVVRAGQLLLEIDSPDWRSLQLDIVDASAARLTTEAKLAQARAARAAAGDIDSAGPTTDDSLPNVFTAAIQAASAERDAAADRFRQLLAKAATLTDIAVEELAETKDGIPRWRRLHQVPIRAVASGVVRQVDAASGTWVVASTEVIHVLQPDALRFRARALQADLIDRIRDGQRARISPPPGRGPARRSPAIRGLVRIGVTGDPNTRTMDVFIDREGDWPEWARPQVVGLADVFVGDASDAHDLAIPEQAIIRDGLEMVFFRRAPDDPDEVIRTAADLGPSDGRWVVVRSGVAEGDEVVVDGIYQLKLATSAKQVESGHFHADGSWHEGENH